MSEVLSSDALERQYGPLIFEVLRQDEAGRIISNTAEGTGKVVELSRIVFRPEGVERFPEVHARILAGISMGTAFRDARLYPGRRIHASSRYDQRGLPEVFARRFDNHEAPIVTDLTLVAGPDGTPYADILEVFRPETRPWEQDGSDMGQEVAGRLESFGAELAALDAGDAGSPDAA